MSYSKEVYEAVTQELQRRRVAAEQEAAALRARMRRDPRVLPLEAVMAGSMRRVAQAVLKGGNAEAEIAVIRAESQKAKAELSAIMKEHGETATSFSPRYTCSQCEDTGFVNGRSCACRNTLLREHAAAELRRWTGMKLCSFETLDLSFYDNTFDERLGCSPREAMKEVLEYCRWYGTHFALSHPNLLLSGPTGTGKTHVSLAIAAAACDRGANVVYGSVQALLHKMEADHFGRADAHTEQTLLDCDLLILDDLGTEFSSPFYTSALYTLINGRMLEGRPTIISTNLDAAAIYNHYGEQIASRLIGTYEPLLFVGRDVRQQKLQRRYHAEG